MKRTKKAGPNYNVYGWIFISLAFLLYIIFTIYPAMIPFFLLSRVLKEANMPLWV